ncbi:Pkinase-domain-containing protein, partial [Fragilariopsis cylindrus CCMP1102]
MTRTIYHYERIEQIGEGTYGQVYRARCKDTNEIVALKKIRVHHGIHWGIPPTVIREIKILKRLVHPNLVRMDEVVSSKDTSIEDAREAYKGNLFLVLEYVPHDLTGLLDIAYKFNEIEIKCIFQQLLEALAYMHHEKYIHRDIKSSNILIDRNFRLKLADFGLARSIEPPLLDKLHDRGNSQEFTNKVITLWYRPPELLLGATKYGTAVDIWSAGCILAELVLGRPLFTGKSEMEQLQLIFDMVGTPTKSSWPGIKELKLLRTGDVTIDGDNERKRPKLRERYSQKMNAIAPGSINLIEKLLELDPSKRLSASRALNHRYFLSEPKAPDQPEQLGYEMDLAVDGSFHEFQTKKKRKEAKIEADKIKQ